MTAETTVRRGRAGALIVACLALALAGLLLFCPLPRAWEGGWRSELCDFGHVPLFAVLTLALRRAVGGPWYRPVLVTLALAALVEIVQPFVGRTGSLADFLRGAAGALAAGALLRAAQGPARWLRLAGHGLAAAALVAYPVVEAGPGLLDAALGIADFPTLADFRSDRQLLRWHCRQAELVRIADPDRPGSFAGRIEFRPGPETYPGATLEHVVRDFSGYRRLCWSFTVEGGPLTLAFSLRGGPDAGGQTSHFQFARTFGPGEHRVEMDLATAARQSEPGPLDTTDLWWSQLFIVRPSEPHVICLRRVWLE
jgi:hypothetical protein